MVENSSLTIGVDLGDRFSHLCVIDAEGAVVEESRVRSSMQSFRTRFGSMPRCRIAMETGSLSPWASRLLESLGHEVLVAHARKLRLIYDNVSKSDRVDAQYLARITRLDPQLLSREDV